MRGLDARRAARGVEATQPLVADRLDHQSTVARCAPRTRAADLLGRWDANPQWWYWRCGGKNLAAQAGLPLSTFVLQELSEASWKPWQKAAPSQVALQLYKLKTGMTLFSIALR